MLVGSFDPEVNGMFSCDLLDMFYYGDGSMDSYIGDQKEFVKKSSYVLTLINAGMIVSAAHVSMANNNPNGWKAVSKQFTDSLVRIADRITVYIDRCINEFANNGKLSTQKLLLNVKRGNQGVADIVYILLARLYPNKAWTVIVATGYKSMAVA